MFLRPAVEGAARRLYFESLSSTPTASDTDLPMDRPHIVLTLADDLGFNGVGYNGERNAALRTPALDRLAATGLRLESFYAYRLCGPSRASLMTGRFPYKLEAVRTNLIEFWEESGTEPEYTLLPEQLRRHGYATFLVGKWHQGFYHPRYLPTRRGFTSFFGFLGGCEDHVTQRNCCPGCERKLYPGVGTPVDLFRDERPAFGENGSATHSHNCLRFGAESVAVVHRYAARRKLSLQSGVAAVQPLFLFLSLQDPHAPYQTPARFESLYRHDLPLRNKWSGMISAIDETVANVSSALMSEGLWETSLFIFASDNGSPVSGWGAGGSNAPLRGGKDSDWEGGVRTPAFISGGWLPAHRRGVRLKGLVHIADLYASFCALAGARTAEGAPGCPSDGGPASVDSIDLSSWWRGSTVLSAGGAAVEPPSPRVEIVHDINGYRRAGNQSGVIRIGDWKLLAKRQIQASWFGPFAPEAPANVSVAQERVRVALDQNTNEQIMGQKGEARGAMRRARRSLLAEASSLKEEVRAGQNAARNAYACSLGRPCLFNIADDPSEVHNLAPQMPAKVDSLRERLNERYQSFHLAGVPRGEETATQQVARWRRGWCGAALANKGFMGPWKAFDDPTRPAYYKRAGTL